MANLFSKREQFAMQSVIQNISGSTAEKKQGTPGGGVPCFAAYALVNQALQ